MKENLNNEHNNYMDLIQENIYIAKMLNNLSDNQKKKISKLLLKKKKIQYKNGLFAEFQLELINKKIRKIREDNNEEK